MFYSSPTRPPVDDEEALYVNIMVLNELIRCHTKGCFSGATAVKCSSVNPQLYEGEKEGLVERCTSGLNAITVHYGETNTLDEFMAVFELRGCTLARQAILSPHPQPPRPSATPQAHHPVTQTDSHPTDHYPNYPLAVPLANQSQENRGDRSIQRGCFEVGCKLVLLERVLLRDAQMRQNRREMLTRVQEILNILVLKARIPITPPSHPSSSPPSQCSPQTSFLSATRLDSSSASATSPSGPTSATSPSAPPSFCGGVSGLREWSLVNAYPAAPLLLDEMSIRSLERAQYESVEAIGQWLGEASPHHVGCKLFYSLGLELETLISLLTSSDEGHLVYVSKVFDNLHALKAASLSKSTSTTATMAEEVFGLLSSVLKWDLRETLNLPHLNVTEEMKPGLLQSAREATVRLSAWFAL